MYERRRLQEEDPEDGKEKQKMFEKTKITKEDTEDEYYRRLSLAKIDDEDVRQVFRNIL